MWLFYIKLAGSSLAWRNIAFCALMIIVPVLCYHLVEAPLIGVGVRIGKRLFRKQVAVSAAA
jgi:peptidoglycan/LPS O-acetylase OafA/YrhL